MTTDCISTHHLRYKYLKKETTNANNLEVVSNKGNVDITVALPPPV